MSGSLGFLTRAISVMWYGENSVYMNRGEIWPWR
jgi:hypothetical protein